MSEKTFSRPIPFEALHPKEARFMASVFAAGLSIYDSGTELFIGRRRQRPSRPLTKYRRTIEWIRQLPDRSLTSPAAP